jgi:dipeptidyl aminopeptidase/acylaminoacyl peptidase
MSEGELEGDSEESGKTDERPEIVLRQHGTWTYAELTATTYARRDIPPVFVAHGTDDRIVPVEQSRKLVDRLRAAGADVDYLEVPGADHVWRGAASVPDIVGRSLDFLAARMRIN